MEGGTRLDQLLLSIKSNEDGYGEDQYMVAMMGHVLTGDR